MTIYSIRTIFMNPNYGKYKLKNTKAANIL